MAARAVKDAFVKLSPKTQLKNPVMFLVYASAALTTLLFVFSLFGLSDAQPALFSPSRSSCGSRCSSPTLPRPSPRAGIKRRRIPCGPPSRDVEAHKIPSPDQKENIAAIASALLKKGDIVIVRAGEQIPADGEVIEGAASVDESAITGESAPVIRESGGDRSAVTGGHHRPFRLAGGARHLRYRRKLSG